MIKISEKKTDYPLRGFKTGLIDAKGNPICQGHILKCIDKDSRYYGNRFVVYYVPNMAGFATYNIDNNQAEPHYIPKVSEYLGFGNYHNKLFWAEVIDHSENSDETKHFVNIAEGVGTTSTRS